MIAVQVNGETVVGMTYRQAMEALLRCTGHLQLLVHRPATKGVEPVGVFNAMLHSIYEQEQRGSTGGREGM